MNEYLKPRINLVRIERKNPIEKPHRKPYEKPRIIELGDVASLSRFDVSVNA